MALDSRDERAGVVAYKLPMGRVFPNADGSLAAPADRQQITGEYPGIAPTPPVVGGGDMMIRHHHHGV